MNHAFAIASLVYVLLILVPLTDMWLSRRTRKTAKTPVLAPRPRRREVQVSEPIF